jgi:hypothetical protein
MVEVDVAAGKVGSVVVVLVVVVAVPTQAERRYATRTAVRATRFGRTLLFPDDERDCSTHSKLTLIGECGDCVAEGRF